MKFSKVFLGIVLLFALFAPMAAEAGNGGYTTGHGDYYWWYRNNHDLNFDTSTSTTQGYAKNPDEVYATQLKQAQTGMPTAVVYPTVAGSGYVQPMPQAQPYYQQQRTVPVNYQQPGMVPTNYVQQGYTQQGYVQQPSYPQAQAQAMGSPVFADPYHAQMEAKARELNLRRTDLAINNVERQEKANDKAAIRDTNYTVRDTFRTVNSAVGTASTIRGFFRGF